MICSIWHDWNWIVHGSPPLQPQVIADMGGTWLDRDDWLRPQLERIIGEKFRWQPPPMASIKLNFDALIHPGVGDLGAVIWDVPRLVHDTQLKSVSEKAKYRGY